MQKFDAIYDAIVIGAGHAGVEACLALARTGHKTLVVTLSLDAIAFMACNPAIGGTAKGHLVREIDALGGQMGIAADANLLQIRMLNTGKGAAVRSLRGQADKNKYHGYMKSVLERQPGLDILQSEVTDILTEDGAVCGVKTAQGQTFGCRGVVVATGVYLNAEIIIGDFRQSVGPNGFCRATGLTSSLLSLGLPTRRFKTGTPARIDGKTVDFEKMTVQNAPVLPHLYHPKDKGHHPRQPRPLAAVQRLDQERRSALLPVHRGQGRPLRRQRTPPDLHRTRMR